VTIKVIVVDDSAVIRGLISRALTKDSNIQIVATSSNGELAIQAAKAFKPDVVILDIEMPQMDGLTALPKILEAAPGVRVIMASTLTQRNAGISLQALQLGATDYLPKPTSTSDGDGLEIFYRDLLAKVQALGAGKIPATVTYSTPTVSTKSQAAVTLDSRPMPAKFSALAIASSTGGPQALQTLFAGLVGKLTHVPIFITQHMPPTFTTILAEHISKASGRLCKEAVDGDVVVSGNIYLAPGDFHMVMEKKAGGEVVTRLNKNAQENFCRPAADPMLRSLADIYGAGLLTVVLTGMGQDGMEGAKVAINKGGFVIAQDEASCVVYGMPKAVVDQKLCKAVLPLAEIAPYLIKAV
jgi:two-component system chemotaxis response regulator CheB